MKTLELRCWEKRETEQARTLGRAKIKKAKNFRDFSLLQSFMRYVLVVLLSLIIPTETDARAQSVFDQRHREVIRVASGERDRSFSTIAAKLKAGNDVTYALAMFDSLTVDESIGGMFYAYSLIGCYLHTESLLPDPLKRKVRDAYRTRSMYRGDTENHWVMYYTGLYLAAQTWPGEEGTRWFNGRSSVENFREAEQWLNHWFSISSTIGQGEFDSPTYVTTFITPMLVLFDFARHPVMKKKAQMMLDLLFVDFAVEHLKGNYGGGHSRDYPEDIVNPLGAPSTFWAWLYFGEPDFPPWKETRFRPRHRSAWEPVFGAVSSYRLPDIIYQIATDRTTPYVHTETKRVRNIIRFGRDMNPPAYKYSFVTKDYILGSLHGGILQPIQQHTWDVTYVSDKPNNTIFTLHPFYSGKELAMFFPEEEKFLSDEVDRYHKVYTNPDKWNSSSPYEQTLQHNNTLIVLYNIERGAKHPHVNGFFPKNLDEFVRNGMGWIFCRAGRTYVALYPLQPYQWIEEEINWRLRSYELNNGFIVEVGSEDEDGSFGEFQRSVRTRKPSHEDFATSLTVRYTTRHGDSMHFTFGGDRIVNGTSVDFKDFRFFNGPFVQSDLRSGIIRMQHKNRTRTLDFNKVTIVDTP